MAIEKTVEINVDSKQAEINLKKINETIDEQRSILVLLEEEYAKSKQALDKYNASGRVNLAQEKQLKAQLTERKDALTDQRLGLKKLAVEQRAATQTVQDFKTAQKENTNIIRGVDKLTGGYATKIIKLKKGFVSGFGAIKKFVKGLSGIKKALIATGIGALVIGLATVIAYWDEITALFDNGSKALQKQAKEHKENISLSDDQLVLLENQEKILKLQGVSTENIVAEKKKVLLLQAEENSLLLDNLKIQLEKEKAQVREVSFFEKTKISALNALGQYEAAAEVLGTSINGTEEQLERLNELEKEIQSTKVKSQKIDIALLTIEDNKKKKRNKETKDRKKENDNELKEIKKQNDEKLKLEQEYQDRLKSLKEKIREAEANTVEEQRLLQLEKLREEHKQLLVEAFLNGLLTEELTTSLKERENELLATFDQQDQDAADKKKQDENDAREKEAADIKTQEEFKENQYRDGYNTLQKIVSLGGKKTEKISKALAIADVVRTASKSVSETVSSISAANAGALGTPQAIATSGASAIPVIALNTAKAALSIGSTIASAGKSISSIRGNAKSVSGGGAPSGGGGGGGGGSAPAPPSFNIVGASETNQLADAIGGQSQAPIQTYVVANDVTTAQSLQNNIVEGATIG